MSITATKFARLEGSDSQREKRNDLTVKLDQMEDKLASKLSTLASCAARNTFMQWQAYADWTNDPYIESDTYGEVDDPEERFCFFPALSAELRSMIWNEAIVGALQDAARSLPDDCQYGEPDDVLEPDADVNPLYHLHTPICRCTTVRRCTQSLLSADTESRRVLLAYKARNFHG